MPVWQPRIGRGPLDIQFLSQRPYSSTTVPRGLRAEAYVGLDNNLPYRTEGQTTSIWVNLDIEPSAGLIQIDSDAKANRHAIVINDLDGLAKVAGTASSVVHLGRGLFAAMNLVANRALFSQTLREPGSLSLTRSTPTSDTAVREDRDGNLELTATTHVAITVGLQLDLEAREQLLEADILNAVSVVLRQFKGDPNEISDASKAIASFSRIAESTSWAERLSNAHASMEHALGNQRMTGSTKDATIASITGHRESDIGAIRRVANRLKHADGPRIHKDAQMLEEFLKSPSKLGQTAIQAARIMLRDTLQVQSSGVP